MATETRWFVSRIGRLSQNNKWRRNPAAKGFLPGFLEFLDPADGLGKPGSWFAHTPAMGVGIGLGAITWDTDTFSRTAIDKVWSKLALAPDLRVFDARTRLSSLEGTWSRRAAFAGILQSRLIDPARFRDPKKDLAHHYRELARTLLFYGFLGRHFHPVDLDLQLSTLTAAGRQALTDHLEEAGFPTAKIPPKTTTFRTFYRAALASSFADFGLDSGAWHLGHPKANLAKR